MFTSSDAGRTSRSSRSGWSKDLTYDSTETKDKLDIHQNFSFDIQKISYDIPRRHR